MNHGFRMVHRMNQRLKHEQEPRHRHSHIVAVGWEIVQNSDGNWEVTYFGEKRAEYTEREDAQEYRDNMIHQEKLKHADRGSNKG